MTQAFGLPYRLACRLIHSHQCCIWAARRAYRVIAVYEYRLGDTEPEDLPAKLRYRINCPLFIAGLGVQADQPAAAAHDINAALMDGRRATHSGI